MLNVQHWNFKIRSDYQNVTSDEFNVNMTIWKWIISKFEMFFVQFWKVKSNQIDGFHMISFKNGSQHACNMNFHICCTWIVHTDFSNRTVPVSHHCSRSDKVIPRIRISIGKSQFENFQTANNCVEGTWRFLLQHIRKVSVVEFSLNTLICDGKWCIDWYWQQRWNEVGTRTKFHYC